MIDPVSMARVCRYGTILHSATLRAEWRALDMASGREDAPLALLQVRRWRREWGREHSLTAGLREELSNAHSLRDRTTAPVVGHSALLRRLLRPAREQGTRGGSAVSRACPDAGAGSAPDARDGCPRIRARPTASPTRKYHPCFSMGGARLGDALAACRLGCGMADGDAREHYIAHEVGASWARWQLRSAGVLDAGATSMVCAVLSWRGHAQRSSSSPLTGDATKSHKSCGTSCRRGSSTSLETWGLQARLQVLGSCAWLSALFIGWLSAYVGVQGQDSVVS